jgi:hypothetical protein
VTEPDVAPLVEPAPVTSSAVRAVYGTAQDLPTAPADAASAAGELQGGELQGGEPEGGEPEATDIAVDTPEPPALTAEDEAAAVVEEPRPAAELDAEPAADQPVAVDIAVDTPEPPAVVQPEPVAVEQPPARTPRSAVTTSAAPRPERQRYTAPADDDFPTVHPPEPSDGAAYDEGDDPDRRRPWWRPGS